MTASYDPTLGTPKDRVRFYIGDTDVNSAFFSDEEIQAILIIEREELLAAAAFADSLAARFSRSVTFSVEGLSISNSQKASNYRELATRLRSQAAASSNGVNSIGKAFVGGVSLGDMRGVMSNGDRPKSRFAVEPQGDYHDGNILPELSSEWP